MTKFQKQVLKKYPNARLEYEMDECFIMNGDTMLSEEYLMPATTDPDKAWEYAAIACRTTQNFNRTHPLRVDGRDVEARVQRILNRKQRSNNVKQVKESI
jgi:hypothetical protein